MAQSHWGDPAASPISIHGIVEFGEWTSTSSTGTADAYNTDNVYVTVPWGDINPAGARITAATSKIEQRTAMSAALKDSFLDQATAQLVIGGMSDGHLTNLRRMMGLPESVGAVTLHSGNLEASPTPSKETLRVQGRYLGSQEYQLYIRSIGPLGDRYYYFPSAKVVDIGEQVYNRAGYLEPGATFDLYEDAQYDNYWIEDAAA